MFGPENVERLAGGLAGIQGQFLLSLNDRPEVRQVFAAFTIEAVETSYTLARHAGLEKRVDEVLISGPA